MNLKITRFQRQTDQGPILFGVTYQVSVTEEERALSAKYPLEEGFVYEATQEMSSQLPSAAEWTEHFKTPEEATKAIDERKYACTHIVTYLKIAARFGGEDTFTF